MSEEDQIRNLIKDRTKEYGYNSANFKLALLKEGEFWKVIMAKIILDISKPQGQTTLLKENNFVLENISVSIEEFYQFLDYLKTVYVGNVKFVGSSVNVTEDMLYKLGSYGLCFVGNFPSRELYFTGRQHAEAHLGIDKPVYHVDYAIHESVSAKAYHKLDLTGHEVPLRNVAEALNHYWGTHYEQHSMYTGSMIYLPIFDASIASCKLIGTTFKFKFDINTSKTQISELSLAVIAQGKTSEYRKKHELKSGELEIELGFVPTYASIFLNKNKIRIDEFNYYSPTILADVPKVTRVVRRNRSRERTSQEIVDSESTVQEIPATKEPTVFVSHAMENLELAKEIKTMLESLGLDVFIAHQDIKPFEIWEDVIFKRIQASAIFVPLLTKDFQRSIWTDQETGIAVASGSVIIPVIIDVNPYGFIAKYQGLRWNSQEFHFKVAELASQIIEHLPNDEKKKLRTEIIDNLTSYEKCHSYDIAGVYARVISNFPSLTDSEINLIARGVIENDQVSNSFRARSSISAILNRYKDQISQKYRDNKIIKKYIL